jgi:hypothetical protein
MNYLNSKKLIGDSFQRKMYATIQSNIFYLLLSFYSAYLIYVHSSDRMTVSKNVDRIRSELIFDCFKCPFHRLLKPLR